MIRQCWNVQTDLLLLPLRRVCRVASVDRRHNSCVAGSFASWLQTILVHCFRVPWRSSPGAVVLYADARLRVDLGESYVYGRYDVGIRMML